MSNIDDNIVVNTVINITDNKIAVLFDIDVNTGVHIVKKLSILSSILTSILTILSYCQYCISFNIL